MSKPRTFVHTIPVRYQDCDAYGIVNGVNYLHFMLEATMAHNAAYGYTFERWLGQGIVWLIRDTEIEFMRPLHYGDTVKVSVRVGDLRRASVSRYYELSIQGSSQLAARARSGFAVASLESLRPVPIPEDMIHAFFPDGITEEASPRRRFPKAPPAPPEVLEWRTTVEWRDLDAQRHVSNATYLSYMQMSVLDQNEKIGWPIQRILEQNQAGVVQKIHILYQGQASIGDEVSVTSYFSALRTSSCTRHDVIKHVGDGSVLVRGHTRWTWVDLETFRPVPIPAEYLAPLQSYFVKDGTS
jgi:YbgC/YbaW family acyl-CoA thioester hydrolase